MAMPKPDLDLDLLRCFVSVVETGSFTLAAKRLHLTQSAVTLKIQRLEEILNHELFCRKSKGFELTLDGAVTLGYAHRLLDLGQELMERIANSTHTVRIGILHHLAFQDFPVSIAEFRRQWPSLHLTLDLGTTEELLEGLENNRFDIVVASSGYTSMADYRMSSNVSEDHLQKETLKWVQSERSQLDPQVDPLPLVTFGPLCRFRPIAFDVLQKASRTWEVVYSGSSLNALQSAIQADLGYAVLPTYSIGPGAKAVPKNAGLPALPQVNLSLYMRKSPIETLAKRVGSFIAESAKRWQTTELGKTEPKPADLESVRSLRLIKSR